MNQEQINQAIDQRIAEVKSGSPSLVRQEFQRFMVTMMKVAPEQVAQNMADQLSSDQCLEVLAHWLKNLKK